MMMKGKSSTLKTMPLVAMVLAVLPLVSAFWRLPCHNPLTIERADPVVSPGAVSAHLHTIMGGNGFDFKIDYAKARTSTCSSCTVKQDLSNYWTPNLFYHAKNGSFHEVKQLGGALIYYLQRRSVDNEYLHAFPKGFSMIAGDSMLRSFTENVSQDAVSFACIDYKNSGPETNDLPNKNCPNGLRAQVFFPSCWDGKNLDSTNHKSHVAYPDKKDDNRCPVTHPVRFISLFYEILFAVDEWKDEWYGNGQPFVFSNGDPTGYGFHGDFVNGWDTTVLQNAVTNCNASSGVIEECPYFKYFPDDITKDCFNPPRIDEQTSGWMPKLPGCNPVQPGPKRATPKTNCGATTKIGGPKTYDTDVSDKGWKYVGCGLDDLDSRTFPFRRATKDMTVDKCIDICEGEGFNHAGLEYGNECWCGNSIAKSRQGMSRCFIPCVGDVTQFCGGGQRLSVYKKGLQMMNTESKLTTTTGKSSASPSTGKLSTSVSISKISTLSRSSSAAQGTPTASPVIAPGWINIGCWVDPINPRALEVAGYWDQPVAMSGCVKHCHSKGFIYAGTENGAECFCGNKITRGAKAAPAKECDMVCKGNKRERCGGSGRLSIFENRSSNEKR